MKNLQTFKSFINEAASIEKGPDGMYHPQSKDELKTLIEQLISERGNEGDFNDIDTSSITDMSELFSMKTEFNGDISKWDTSNVTDMGDMFSVASSFNQPIGNWDISKVTNMERMFKYAHNFNQPIGNWDVRNVKNMRNIFHGADSFNQPIGNWDVSNVTDMNGMFNGAESFNQDISKWNINDIIIKNHEYSFMFDDCSINFKYRPKFKKLSNKSYEYDIPVNMTCDFEGTSDYNLKSGELPHPIIIVSTDDEKMQDIIINEIIKNKGYKGTEIETVYEATPDFQFIMPEAEECTSDDEDYYKDIVYKLLKKYYTSIK